MKTQNKFSLLEDKITDTDTVEVGESAPTVTGGRARIRRRSRRVPTNVRRSLKVLDEQQRRTRFE